MSIPMNGNAYEAERQKRIADNNKKLEELGLLKQRSIMDSFAPCKRGGPSQDQEKKAPRPYQPRLGRRVVQLEPRRSRRIQGEHIDYCEIDEHDNRVRLTSATGDSEHLHADELLDLMDRRNLMTGNVHEMEPEQQEQLQQIRCGSQGRGSLYDSAVGITCHFCRQKKLCGENDCPRCQFRDANAECIGKTDCSKCHSANGKFCRACLLIRYGYTLEEVRIQMAAGNWLCPHCYEDEKPEEGYICNSSICMKRRGLKPTGIAIYDAQAAGFKSVAHLLQAQLKKMGGVAALRRAAEGGEAVDVGLAAGTSQDTTAAREEGPSQEGAAPAGPSGQQEGTTQQSQDGATQVPSTRRSSRSSAAAPLPPIAGRVSKKKASAAGSSAEAAATPAGQAGSRRLRSKA